ncbi:zinc ABC transporter substrate-binding protein AdcA [Streptococcus sp. DD12]|uniref:zinc ABC transporter substrate-binding protein AdcA n=1 Tax=Streptococcus sp. DD12 TaxID=1777880 RepID=UPI0007922B79|nr:zinc ABC transporter substrate-binding protein AdcA [Streptococcus sp. DD12]KXT76805.1 putative zinc-binding lipoprotein ZinT [Streptococcus sp. DD12]
MKKLGLLALSLFSWLVVGQFFAPQKVSADDKIKVVTTFYPVYEFTKAVTGDQADVSMLMKAGTEPHDFDPSTKDVAKISDADVFVYLDPNMETWEPKVIKSIDKKNLTVIQATGDMLLAPGVAEEEEEGHEGHTHAYDPHVWLSPKRAITLVNNIRDALIAKYPDKKDSFTANAKAYTDKLSQLDKEYTEALSNAKQKSFVTQHAAFGYLALDYGLNQIAISGVSPDTEPSAKRLASLSKYIKKYDIQYIYFEENASSKVSKTLAKEAGVKTAVLNPLESLTNKELKSGEDYFSVMKENLKSLKKTTDKAGKEIEPETDTKKTVANGYFKDKDIKNRTLSDWTGDWQSVYPYLQDGSLDGVWDYKAKSKKDQSAEAYKAYYETGYKTDVSAISINGKKNTMTFTVNGEKKTYTYTYKGYKVLTYKKGNRGVRYLFEAKEADAGNFKYIQFSDHNIAPTKAEHFHIFMGGESQEKLLEEMDNWPTYYPAKLTGHEIAQEMIAH